jgi:hypothetical protein
VVQVKTPASRSPGAWGRRSLREENGARLFLSDTMVCDRSGRFFKVWEEMPVIETWGSINRDTGIFSGRVIRTCIVWTGYLVF